MGSVSVPSLSGGIEQTLKKWYTTSVVNYSLSWSDYMHNEHPSSSKTWNVPIFKNPNTNKKAVIESIVVTVSVTARHPAGMSGGSGSILVKVNNTNVASTSASAPGTSPVTNSSSGSWNGIGSGVTGETVPIVCSANGSINASVSATVTVNYVELE